MRKTFCNPVGFASFDPNLLHLRKLLFYFTCLCGAKVSHEPRGKASVGGFSGTSAKAVKEIWSGAFVHCSGWKQSLFLGGIGAQKLQDTGISGRSIDVLHFLHLVNFFFFSVACSSVSKCIDVSSTGSSHIPHRLKSPEIFGG